VTGIKNVKKTFCSYVRIGLRWLSDTCRDGTVGLRPSVFSLSTRCYRWSILVKLHVQRSVHRPTCIYWALNVVAVVVWDSLFRLGNGAVRIVGLAGRDVGSGHRPRQSYLWQRTAHVNGSSRFIVTELANDIHGYGEQCSWFTISKHKKQLYTTHSLT